VKQQKPILHGRDHITGGADPIPGLLTSDTTAGGDWEETIVGLGADLRGFWRLGEGATPYADTSGHTGGAADLSRHVQGTAMTQDVTPGLLPTSQDDGAVGFNNAGGTGDFLEKFGSIAGRFDFDSGDADFTVVARIKPTASASTFYGHVAGTMTEISGGPNYNGGWQLRVHWPDMLVSLARGGAGGAGVLSAESATGISGGTEYTVAGSYDGSTIRVYINGTLADTTADTHNLPALGNIRVGGTDLTGSTWSPFFGVIDEVAVWGDVLTDDQIAGLHVAAATPDDIAAGWVLTADGAGSSTWAAPTIEVEY